MVNPHNVPYVNFKAQYDEEKNDIHRIVDEVFSAGDFVSGAYVGTLEKSLAEYINVKEVVVLNSGTDALIYGMRALGIKSGDEVITPPNSFIASTASIIHVGATPVFVDVLPDQNIDPEKIERAITHKTKAIMVVHLTGRICEMDAIKKIAKKNNLFLIEDAAQAIGSRYGDQMAGTFGDFSCFSAHPLKNLNAAGDAGFLTTANSKIAEAVRQYRMHGLIDRNTALHWGEVSRLDTLQAGILLYRLKKLPDLITKRRTLAKYYQQQLSTMDEVYFPPCTENRFNTFHTFVVQVENRDALQKYLLEQNIQTAIHYPIPIHLQPAAEGLRHQFGDFPVTEKQAARIISLPINQYLNESDVSYVCEKIKSFYVR